MGYYAELVQGGTITIDDPQASIDRLLKLQGDSSFSWIDRVENYTSLASVTFTDSTELAANALSQLLTDYGFDTEIDPNSGVLLNGWDGEKIGMSWENIWQGIGAGVSSEDPVCWVMRGDDGQHWAEIVGNGLSNSYSVDISYNVNA